MSRKDLPGLHLHLSIYKHPTYYLPRLYRCNLIFFYPTLLSTVYSIVLFRLSICLSIYRYMYVVIYFSSFLFFHLCINIYLYLPMYVCMYECKNDSVSLWILSIKSLCSYLSASQLTWPHSVLLLDPATTSWASCTWSRSTRSPCASCRTRTSPRWAQRPCAASSPARRSPWAWRWSATNATTTTQRLSIATQ